MDDFNYNLIDKAYNVIKEHVIKTPLVTNDNINKLLGSKVFFKLENLQKTGSKKCDGVWDGLGAALSIVTATITQV